MTETDETCKHGTPFTKDCWECRSDENGRYIEQLVKQAQDHAAAALDGAHRLHGVITELTSNQVYDIEFAEGSAGPDTLAEVSDALRHLRNAERIIKARAQLLQEG
jgi:hypothetical protein